MKQIIIKLFFGVRTQGIKLTTPTFHTQEPSNRPPLNQWVNEYNFGSRYGYRGSFYGQN
jgi:hypothetical protein